jgi:hypothetical protein
MLRLLSSIGSLFVITVLHVFLMLLISEQSSHWHFRTDYLSLFIVIVPTLATLVGCGVIFAYKNDVVKAKRDLLEYMYVLLAITSALIPIVSLIAITPWLRKVLLL